MNLFEAFNIEEPKAVSPKELMKKKEAKAKSSPTKTSSSTAKAAVSGDVEINHETIIRFEGITHPITVYFTDEEIEEGIIETDKGGTDKKRKVTAEDIRIRMEEGLIQVDDDELMAMGLFGLQGYVDLVPSITKIHVEKEKNMIIPVKQAGKKGFRDNSLRLPKIPYRCIMEFWRLARYYAKRSKVEVHADLYWHAEQNKYVIDFPRQLCEQLNVEVLYTNPLLSAEMKKVMEVHSHHVMPPLPSSQDNHSERCPGMLYMIVGGYKQLDEHDLYVFETGKLYPDITIRTFHKNEHVALNLWDFVEHPFEDISMAPLQQLEVVGNE